MIRYLTLPTNILRRRMFFKISQPIRLYLDRRTENNRMLRTMLGAQLAPLNSEVGLVIDKWGTILLMALVMVLFLTFISILVELYSASIILDNFDLDWSAGSTYVDEYFVL